MLDRLNTHGIGLAGLALGGGAIVTSVAALFALFTNKDTGPQYLIALAFAADDLAQRRALTSMDQMALAQFACAVIGIIGAIVLALLMSWLGRPSTVPSANASGAAQASATPPKKDNS